LDDKDIGEYCYSRLKSESTVTLKTTVETAIENNVNNVFIFSMGLQWVNQHAQILFNLPCTIASPAIKYHPEELDQMISNLSKSKEKTLKLFYRQCCSSMDDWARWKLMHLESHVRYNNQSQLIKWLDTYGRQSVQVPNHKNIRVWLDKKDPIGVKPVKDKNSKYKFMTHSNGHLITPQHIHQMLN